MNAARRHAFPSTGAARHPSSASWIVVGFARCALATLALVACGEHHLLDAGIDGGGGPLDAATPRDSGLDGATLVDAPRADAPGDSGLCALPPEPEFPALEPFFDAVCEFAVRCALPRFAESGMTWNCHPAFRRFTPWAAPFVAAGRGQIDEAAVAACAEAVARSASCFEAYSALESDPCMRSAVGPREAGEPCGHAVECQRDHRCEPAEGCPGTCAPLPGEGEPCPDFRCASELSCVTEGAERVCRPPGDLGEPCGSCRAGLICSDRECTEPPGEGEPCGLLFDCADDRICAFGTCHSPPGTGEACFADVACAVGAQCVEGICREVALPWQACGGGRVCPGTFHCGPCGVCEPLPTAGEPCDEAIGCALSACVEGTCRLLPNGAPCDQWEWPDACEGHCGPDGCDDTRPEGEACFWSPECDPGLVCRLGVCRELCD